MKIFSSGTDPTHDAELVCRNTRFGLLILLFVFWGAAGLWWWLEAPRIVVYGCAAVALFISPFLIGSWRNRGKACNWVVALHPDGIWLNLRDSEYHEFEPGNTIVFLPYGEIETARKHIHRYSTSDSDGNTSHKDVYLGLTLSCDTTELRNAIQAERKRPSAMREYFGGFIRIGQKKIKRMPIELKPEGDKLHIKFSASNFGLSPRLSNVLAVLQKYVQIEGEEEQNDGRWQDLDDTKFDELFCQLIRDGHDIKASKLLRRKQNISISQARKFIEEVREQMADHSLGHS